MPASPNYTQQYKLLQAIIALAPNSDTSYPTGFSDAPNLRDVAVFDHTTNYTKSGTRFQTVTLAAVWDLLSSVPVGSCKFSASADDPGVLAYNYKLFSSSDGSSWTARGSTGTLGTPTPSDVTIGSINVSARYWKLELYAAGDALSAGGTVTLYDFRVLDNSATLYSIGNPDSGQDCSGQGR